MQPRIVETALAIIFALVATTATADSITISFDEFSEGLSSATNSPDRV